MTEFDDGIRGEVGIVVSTVELPDGRLRLVLDDVTHADGRWRPSCLFTWNDYEPGAFAAMNLSNEEFQRIGEMIVARIHAFGVAGD